MLHGTAYDAAVDWWTLGCLVFEMAVGVSPFKCPDMGLLVQMILKVKYTIPESISAPMASLIKALLTLAPATRLGSSGTGAEAVQAHPFFSSIDWDLLMKKQIPAPTQLDIDKGGGHADRTTSPGLYEKGGVRLCPWRAPSCVRGGADS